MQQLVLTAVGPDRPGLVDELTGYLTDAGANIADSRMVNLRGQFALIILVEGPDPVALGVLEDAASIGQRIGLTVNVTPQRGSVVPPARAGVPYRLKAYAMDQPGIVHRITHLLHRHGVNIEELATTLQPGSVTGTPLFTMDLRMTVPAAVPIKTLRRELDEMCDALNCDVDLEPA